MPTFDFSNVVKKLISVAVSVTASPVVWVIAAGTALSLSVGFLTTWWDSISVPSIDAVTTFSFDSDLLRVLMYAINSDMLVSIINWITNTIVNTINFLIQFSISLFVVLLTVGITSVIRKSLKDWQ